MDETQERTFYQDNIDSLKRHIGMDLKGILTPAITNTERTPALIAESGMLYHADWVHDDVPVPILVPGHKLISMPYSYDLNDAPLWDGRPYGGQYFVQACKDAFDRLYLESDESGKVFCIALHPYQIGQPHHIGHLRQILDHIASHAGVWFATANDIAEHYLANHYDTQLTHAQEVQQRAEEALSQAKKLQVSVLPLHKATSLAPGPWPAQRQAGYDHPHLGWSPLPKRAPLRWPGKPQLAVVPLLILEAYEDPLPSGWPQVRSVGGGLIRDFPNISRVSTREYGHRVGVYRILDALRKRGIKPTVAVDAMTAEQYPELIEQLKSDGSEFVAHGLSVTRPQTSAMSADDERAYIAETLSRLQACGLPTQGWFGADYSESTLTPQLLGEFGIEYVSDWANDEQPYSMNVPGSMLSTPLWADFDDQTVLINRMCNLDMFEDHYIKALNQLAIDSEKSARLLHHAVRPWVMGAPLRIASFERMLDHALSLPQTWMPQLRDVVRAWHQANPRQT
jgi:hypothetical protein